MANLDYTLLNKDIDFNRKIKGLSVHRAGLELAFENTNDNYYDSYVIGWGTKEASFLKTLTEAEIRSRLGKILNKQTPLLILSNGFTKAQNIQDIVINFASKIKIPVVTMKQRLSNIIAAISVELMSLNAKVVSEHGSLVIINGVGVMMKGKSGIGKSEALLELIQRGFVFVSDDTVEISRQGGKFIGRAARITRGFLEARGIGIIDVAFIYGAKSIKYETNLDLVVELVPETQINSVDRLGTNNLYHSVLGGKIPKMQIPITLGRSIASLIIAATNVFLARKRGMNPLQIIRERREK